MLDATNLVNTCLNIIAKTPDEFDTMVRQWMAGEKVVVIRQDPDEAEGVARVALWDAVKLPPDTEGGSQ